jgi:hypothetical protein
VVGRLCKEFLRRCIFVGLLSLEAQRLVVLSSSTSFFAQRHVEEFETNRSLAQRLFDLSMPQSFRSQLRSLFARTLCLLAQPLCIRSQRQIEMSGRTVVS